MNCADVKRTIISISPLPASPISASQLSGADKSRLAQQESDAVIMIQAPFFLEPVDNSQFEVPVSVTLKVRHLAQCQAGFDIQRKSSLGAPWKLIPSPNGWYNTDHRESTDGTMATSAFIYYHGTRDETGDFRIRTRCRTENALDSEWLYFELNKTLPPRIIEPAKGESFSKDQLVTIKVKHHQGLNVKFMFQWSPEPKTNGWPTTPVDVFPVPKLCQEKPEGETSCQFYFTDVGLYRVYAQYQEDPLLPVSEQSFKIKNDSLKKLKIKPSTNVIKPTSGKNILKKQ